MENNKIIERAIEYCYKLIDKFDNNKDIDDDIVASFKTLKAARK